MCKTNCMSFLDVFSTIGVLLVTNVVVEPGVMGPTGSSSVTPSLCPLLDAARRDLVVVEKVIVSESSESSPFSHAYCLSYPTHEHVSLSSRLSFSSRLSHRFQTIIDVRPMSGSSKIEKIVLLFLNN